MITEYRNDKTALLSAIEQADSNLHAHVSAYALLETQDPLSAFDVRWVHKAGEQGDAEKLLNERLFDRAFLDFGYKEVRDEDNLEGVLYEPIEELFVNKQCIGVAPLSFFDDEATSVRMAHGADEDDAAEDNPDVLRFGHFLKLVQGRVIDGEPQSSLLPTELSQVIGLIFKYSTGAGPDARCVVAFQRTQRMWIQQKSSFLLFNEDDALEAYAGRSIRVGSAFDFLLFDGKLFFRSLNALEILFKFNRLVSQRAKDYADTLDPILADFEKLDERIDASRGVANRLLKLQREGTPIVQMDADELQYKANRIAYYSSKLKFNEEGKVMLTTNREVNDFIRMLNDEYLVSPLSQSAYEARTKKPLDVDEE